MVEITSPDLLEKTVERVDAVITGMLPLEIELREVNAPEFADVVFGTLEIGWM